ncbi:FadR/GntR family transcriptional regulator [Pseudomonas chlororaphis]|uniref:FadR/GntR family transcriptional regulator n=1 Tax=Pseudomonas chlororaphis TaxID=587753 RepID=UPI00046F8CF0|nr:FadR/GntR family transcriptional regulator [Pseudomonas chlororaphis]
MSVVTSGFQAKQIYEQVAETIREQIIGGIFLPGSRLPSERDLAAQLGVSRPAVREAIGALQNEGLVATRHGSGTYVTQAGASVRKPLQDVGMALPPMADLSPIATLEVRMILEPAIARLAAKKAKRNLLAERYLAQMADVHNIEDPAQQALWKETDRLFHRQLAAMTEDPLIIKIADVIAETMEQPLWNRLRDDGIFDYERIQLYVAEHRLIYEAIITGDADAAALYVEGHIKRVRRDIAPQ